MNPTIIGLITVLFQSLVVANIRMSPEKDVVSMTFFRTISGEHLAICLDVHLSHTFKFIEMSVTIAESWRVRAEEEALRAWGGLR